MCVWGGGGWRDEKDGCVRLTVVWKCVGGGDGGRGEKDGGGVFNCGMEMCWVGGGGKSRLLPYHLTMWHAHVWWQNGAGRVHVMIGLWGAEYKLCFWCVGVVWVGGCMPAPVCTVFANEHERGRYWFCCEENERTILLQLWGEWERRILLQLGGEWERKILLQLWGEWDRRILLQLWGEWERRILLQLWGEWERRILLQLWGEWEEDTASAVRRMRGRYCFSCKENERKILLQLWGEWEEYLLQLWGEWDEAVASTVRRGCVVLMMISCIRKFVVWKCYGKLMSENRRASDCHHSVRVRQAQSALS